MKRVIFTVMILSFSLAVFGIKYNLKDAVVKGIEINYNIKDLNLQKKIKYLNRDIASNNGLFNIDINSTYLFRSDKTEIILPDMQLSPTVIIPGKTMEAGVYNNFDLNLSVKQPIYTGGSIKNSIKLSNNEIKLTENKIKTSKIIIANKIKTSFFSFLFLKEEMSLLQSFLEELNLHKQKIKNMFKEALIGKTAVYETDIRIEEILLKINELKRKISTEKINFKYLCGVNIENIDENYSEEVETYNQSLEFFKQTHPLLKSIDISKDNLIIRKKILNGGYLPNILGFMEFHYGKPGINFFQNEWTPYIQAGINISFKAFDWNKRGKKTEIIKFLEDKIYERKKDIIKTIAKNLNILYKSKLNLENNLKRIKKILKDLNEIKTIKENLFNEKQISNLDYLGFLQKIKKNEILQKKTRIGLQLIKIKINNLMGKI